MTPAPEAEGEVGCAFRRMAVPPSKPATAAARAMFFTLLFVMGRKTFLYRLRPHAFVCDGRLWTEANILTEHRCKRMYEIRQCRKNPSSRAVSSANATTFSE